ncbi:MAG: hypothetical protein KIS74_02950 [Burkholderiales bacterium]|nr:hypothetical protein [Burkholderiales bacterium]
MDLTELQRRALALTPNEVRLRFILRVRPNGEDPGHSLVQVQRGAIVAQTPVTDAELTPETLAIHWMDLSVELMPPPPLEEH